MSRGLSTCRNLDVDNKERLDKLKLSIDNLSCLRKVATSPRRRVDRQEKKGPGPSREPLFLGIHPVNPKYPSSPAAPETDRDRGNRSSPHASPWAPLPGRRPDTWPPPVLPPPLPPPPPHTSPPPLLASSWSLLHRRLQLHQHQY